MPAQQTIALLGAPGTGAPELAQAIQRQLADPAMTIKVIAAADVPSLPHDMRHTLRGAAITLLMGLDVGCPAPEQVQREAFDAHLRALLSDAAVRYHVVYGQGPRRIENALHAIRLRATPTDSVGTDGSSDAQPMRLRARDCEKCSDPECEHRLFSALTGRIAASHTG